MHVLVFIWTRFVLPCTPKLPMNCKCSASDNIGTFMKGYRCKEFQWLSWQCLTNGTLSSGEFSSCQPVRSIYFVLCLQRNTSSASKQPALFLYTVVPSLFISEQDNTRLSCPPISVLESSKFFATKPYLTPNSCDCFYWFVFALIKSQWMFLEL